MIAYNRDWLDALWVKETASEWHKEGLLTDEQWLATQARHPSNFYTPNLFIRIGLAIFCLILVMAAMGLLALFMNLGSEIALSIFSLFLGIVILVVLETWAIKSARHRRSGIDDMLLYVGIGALLTGLCANLHYSTPMIVYYGIALPFLVVGSIRYIDRLMAIAAFFCGLFILLLIVKDIPKLALYLLPFAGMAFSALAYFFAQKGQLRYEWRYWHELLVVVEMLAMGTFYASGNYWLIQQAGAGMFQLEQVPIPWFFWGFTFVVPVAYIARGLQRKDRLMMDIGLACIAVAVFTFRYYFNVLPIAWAATVSGAVLFAIAYFSIRHLKNNPGVYNYDEKSDASLLQEIEEQLIEQTIANQPGATPDHKDSFGGGQFGGSGASGEF